MSARSPLDDIIENPEADADLVRRLRRHGFVPIYVALSMAASAAVTALLLFIFPPLETATVSSGDAAHIAEDGQVVTMAETVATQSPNPLWGFLAIGVTVVFITAATTLRARLPRRLDRKHPDIFADASLLDGYVIEEAVLVSEKDYWDAAQHERSARALERERSLYAHAPALSPRQKALVEKHTAEIEDARVAAATILNSET